MRGGLVTLTSMGEAALVELSRVLVGMSALSRRLSILWVDAILFGSHPSLLSWVSVSILLSAGLGSELGRRQSRLPFSAFLEGADVAPRWFRLLLLVAFLSKSCVGPSWCRQTVCGSCTEPSHLVFLCGRLCSGASMTTKCRRAFLLWCGTDGGDWQAKGPIAPRL